MRRIEAKNRRVAVLRDLERSGLTMAEFCRQRELPYARVAAWRMAARRELARFVEVEVACPDRAAAAQGEGREVGGLCAELALPGGAVLRIYQRHGAGGAR